MADCGLEAINVYWPLLKAEKAAPALRDSLLIGWFVPDRRRINCFATGNFGDSHVYTSTVPINDLGSVYMKISSKSPSSLLLPKNQPSNPGGLKVTCSNVAECGAPAPYRVISSNRSCSGNSKSSEFDESGNSRTDDSRIVRKSGSRVPAGGLKMEESEYTWIDYLNIIVAGYVNLTSSSLRQSQISDLCDQLNSIEGLDNNIRNSVTVVGSLFVDGLSPVSEVRGMMAGRRYWLDMEVVMETSWPRVYSLWLGRDRVICKNPTDIIFYQYPSGSFSYSSSLLDTVSLLRRVRMDASAQNKGGVVWSDSKNPSTKLLIEVSDPFELVLQRLNVSDRVSALAQNWKFSDEMTTNGSDSRVVRRNRSTRRRVRNVELIYSVPTVDNTPVTPDGRAAVDKSLSWVVLIVKLARCVIMPLCTIIGSVCTLAMSVKVPRRQWCLLLTQTHTRIRACAQWPTICLRMGQLKAQNTPILLGYNMILISSIVSFLVDIMIGWSINYILIKHPLTVLGLLHQAYNFLHIDVLKAQIDWLMGFPAGLKLNDRLSFFIGEILLASVDKWNQLTSFLAPLELAFLRTAAFISLGGASFLVAAALDILAFCTLHVFYIYVFVSQMTRVSLRLLQSLSYLFRERKWNVLRLRVDSCEYGVDQLLIGSVAFTCLLMLFPTVLVFYLSFASIWLIILCKYSLNFRKIPNSDATASSIHISSTQSFPSVFTVAENRPWALYSKWCHHSTPR